ncbi:MAG: hypothetical protein AAGA75_21980 [Cyanobacteria bacterium P01_E01_bin.6]
MFDAAVGIRLENNLMEIPSQLRDIISTLSPDESEEMRQLIEGLPKGDKELSTLINENLESLAHVLMDEHNNTLSLMG